MRLLLGIVAVTIALASCGGSTPPDTAGDVSAWLADLLLGNDGQDDLFFSAFTTDSGGVFSPQTDQEVTGCFTLTFVEEIAAAGPSDIYPTIDEWRLSKPSGSRDTFIDLRALFGSRIHSERVAIGEAATAAVDRCGHVREAIATRYTGDWPGACVVDAVDSQGSFAEIVALGLAIQVDLRDEPAVEATMDEYRQIWMDCRPAG